MKQKNNNLYIIWISFIVALGGFLFGYDTGVIGGTQLYFTEYFKLTAAEQGLAVSSALYGALVGAILAGYLSNKISRKYTLILSALLFAISSWGSGDANTLTILVIYRIVGGLGVGIASMTAPMYIAEVAPAKQRGFLVSLYQLAVVFGFFIVFLATYFIGGGDTTDATSESLKQIHIYNINKGWRTMFWSELIPAAVFFILLFTVPFSPRWLMIKNKETKAIKVLNKLLGSEQETKNEIIEIKKSLSESHKTSYRLLFAKGMGFVLFIGIMLSVFQQVTGINAILYYGAEIFSNALGYGPEDALKQQLWLGTVNLIFTFIAIFTIDSWGRKPLLITGIIGMFLGLTALGLSIYFKQMGVISLISILVFIGSFALSLGPVVWVLLSEIFPNNIRSIAMSIAVAAQWLFNGIVAYSFPVINKSEINTQDFNGSLSYFIFATMCIVTIIFIWKFVPETKGKTLEEIGKSWK
ncbi:MAG: sugar porter family MFS transporter [Bacteroidota bacterium]